MGPRLPDGADARLGREPPAAALAGDEPEHPRADADLPGGADRERGRHTGLRRPHQRVAERRPRSGPQGPRMGDVQRDDCRVPVLDSARGRREEQGRHREDPAANPPRS